eukprot:scaffold261_cov170-Amphora_coffeaeformis.AAC.12
MTTETTMKREELLNDFPPKASERYDCLESVLRKALQASQTHFDVETAMTDVYGADDVASFGKDTLRVFFDSGLDKIQQQVLARMATYCQEHKIPDELLKLESLALKLEREATWEQYLERQDHSSAQNALERAKLPTGFTAEDVVQFHLHEQLLAQEAALKEELAQIEAQVAKLEHSNQTVTESFQQNRGTVARLTTEMEKAADTTSTVTK